MTRVRQYQRNGRATRLLGISPNGRYAIDRDADIFRIDLVSKQQVPLMLGTSVPTAVADNGNVVVYGKGTPEVPLIWDYKDVTELPSILGGRRGGHAIAMNQSGDLVVGHGLGPNSVETSIWSKSAGTISLAYGAGEPLAVLLMVRP